MAIDLETGVIVNDLGKLTAALAKAQMSFGTVTRSKTVTVTTKTGGSYKFSYAPLDSILDAVRKPLAENGLAVAQLLDGQSLVTLLLHESGASLEGRTAIPQTADVQALGSAITYLRRYAIQALLGIAAEEDDDGKAAKDDKPEKKEPQREYGRAKFPPDRRAQAAEPPAPAEQPIPEAAPFRPLVGPNVPDDGQHEPPRPKAEPGMVQCESKSPYAPHSQCRREKGHTSHHRTNVESWT